MAFSPRRLRFHRSGWIVSVGSLGLGVAAITTGNNLLFLLLGAMLGFIVVSGWLSEGTLRRVEVRRRVPRGVTAGVPAHLVYEVRNAKRQLPSYGLEVGEVEGEARGFLPVVAPGATAYVRVEAVWPRRGVHALADVELSTSFPFGLFQKERDVAAPDEVVVWPRTDRAVREVRTAGELRRRPAESVAAAGAGARGEYRSLRPYRPGDDPRDVHWRSAARVGEPVIREYERDQAQSLWICLDLEPAAGAARAEVAVEIAATLAARCCARGRPFALAAGATLVPPGTGTAQLERVLDVLARAQPGGPVPRPPAPREECVLVAAGAAAGGWGDVVAAEEAGR